MGQLPEKGRPGVGQAPKKSPKLALRDYLAFIPLLPPWSHTALRINSTELVPLTPF